MHINNKYSSELDKSSSPSVYYYVSGPLRPVNGKKARVYSFDLSSRTSNAYIQLGSGIAHGIAVNADGFLES